MAKFTLVIGNKNYSSWSLRPWLVLKEFKIPFDEIRLPLHTAEFEIKIKDYSPSGRVPVLIDGDVHVWDSLAICEYLAERYTNLSLWPANIKARGVARSVANEMHSGFMELRTHMPMNVRASHPGRGMAPGVQENIDRIQTIWKDARSKFGKDGPFLFSKFSIADAMYAPVAFRFHTYGVFLDPAAEAYKETLLGLPSMKEWAEAAKQEKETFPELVKK